MIIVDMLCDVTTEVFESMTIQAFTVVLQTVYQ